MYLTLTAVAALGAAAAAVSGARRRFLLVRVSGSSMTPAYADGERLVARRARRNGPIRVDQVVVVTQRDLTAGTPTHLVKRVRAVAGDPAPDSAGVVPAGHLWVEGDARDNSYDSRHFGPVAVGEVRAIAPYRPPASSGHHGRNRLGRVGGQV